MAILAIDIGTTHCKVGLYSQDGLMIKLSTCQMKVHRTVEGWSYFDPDELCADVVTLIKEVREAQKDFIIAVGVASMAETGLLINRETGAACSFMIPWFETASQSTANWIIASSDPLTCYRKYGLKATYKTSLAKILWLREKQNMLLQNMVWLSTADYVVYRLTGVFQTDVSLASRTFAFRVDHRDWDWEWLQRWHLPENIFPPAKASGEVAGLVNDPAFGLPVGIPVSVCGHDHVCAAMAVGGNLPGTAYDSMGTAEALIGILPSRELTQADYKNGLLYGCHTIAGMGYWLGGLSASGGSVEWITKVLGLKSLGYAEIERMSSSRKIKPTGIFYFPYLLGSSSPHTNPFVRGAFIGLSDQHTTEDLYHAVLEGTAYEMELIRRSGEKMGGEKLGVFTAAGGGTRNRTWMQIKADVTGCDIQASVEPEATLLGAMLLAGIGNGIYGTADEARKATAHNQSIDVYLPNMENHEHYQQLFLNGYLPFQETLHQFTDLTRINEETRIHL